MANTSISIAKEHMAMLSALLTSYDDLIAGRIGNSLMTKEDYDQVDPEEMELMDVRWALATAIRRAQRFMDVTGRKDLMNPNTKLGFDKSKVRCFNCGKNGHFKRECTSKKQEGGQNPFGSKPNFTQQSYQYRPQPPQRTQARPALAPAAQDQRAIVPTNVATTTP